MNRRLAKVRISAELLRDRLCFPSDAVIVQARTTDRIDAAGFELECVIESQSLGEVNDGCVIPTAIPMVKTTIHPGLEVVEFDRWTY